MHEIQYRSTDKAGNVEVAKTMEVKIDKAAPETKHKLTPAPNGQGWNNTDVVVELTATDKLSGVVKTEYNDGSGWKAYTGPITLSAEKVHKIQYRSTDKAGNVTVVKSVEVKIDKTAPLTTHQLTPSANGNGWYNEDVEVILASSDNFSGVSYTEYNDGSGWKNYTGPFTITEEGIHTIQYRSVDHAGNVETIKKVEIKIDKTKPVLIPDLGEGDILWPPNHKMVDIQVSVDAHDDLSGIESWVLTDIKSNEPEDGKGDGNHKPDIAGADYGTPDTQFQLRSERSGMKDGRVYTITYKAVDQAGNETIVSVTAEVPHDMSKSNKK